MKLKIILLFITILFLNKLSFAQSNNKLIYGVDLGYLLGENSNSISNKEYNALRIKGSLSYLVKEKLAVGFSIGTDNYREKERKKFSSFYNTLPISLNGTYFLNNDLNGLFANASLGYAPKVFNNFEKGLNLGVGVGYAFTLGKATNTNLKIGYNLQKINNAQFINSTYSDLNLSSLVITIGITF